MSSAAIQPVGPDEQLPSGWKRASASEVDNDDLQKGTILTHCKGAQIAVHDGEEGKAVRFYFPSGRISLFNAPVEAPEDLVSELAERFTKALAVDEDKPDDFYGKVYFAVVNEGATGNLPLCREPGGDNTIFSRATIATITARRIQHNYENPCITTVRLDKTRQPVLG